LSFQTARMNVHLPFWFRSKRFLFALTGAALVAAGCAQVPAVKARVVATIDRVEILGGSYLSPRRGRVAPARLYLRALVGGGSSRKDLRVEIGDLYSDRLYGSRGDTVAFGVAGPLPLDGRLEFASVRNYTVLFRRGDP
jgi:hypothetical protein